MAHSLPHRVHLPLGALLSPCTVCGTGWHIAWAIVPALMLTSLFFFDHNVSSILLLSVTVCCTVFYCLLLSVTVCYCLLSQVSSILAQSPKFGLHKPPSFHWDFLVLGLTVNTHKFCTIDLPTPCAPSLGAVCLCGTGSSLRPARLAAG